MPAVTSELRRAILAAHGGQCAYTAQPLDESVLAIDHIIPQALDEPGRAAERAEALTRFGRRPEFDLTSLENLVPTTGQFNTRKSDHVVLHDGTDWDAVIRRGLASASAHRDRVAREWDRLRAEQRVLNAHQAYPGALNPGRVHDLLARVPNRFADRDPVPGRNPFEMSRSGVRVTCYLPDYPRVTGSALVEFRTLLMRGSGITLDHDDILTYLVPGAGGGVTPEERPFVVGFGHVRDGGEDRERVVVQLPHNRFWLSREHAAQLAEIADRVTEAFAASAEAAERDVLESATFPRARDGGYRLLRLPARDWSRLLAYAAARSYEAGPLPEHAFDVRGATVVVYGDETADNGVYARARLAGEVDDPSDVTALAAARHDVWVCWRPTFAEPGMDGAARFATGVAWSVERTHRWLMHTLLPAAAAWAVADSTQSAAGPPPGHNAAGVAPPRFALLRSLAGAVLPSHGRSAGATPPSPTPTGLTPAQAAEALLTSWRDGDAQIAPRAVRRGTLRWTDAGALVADLQVMQAWYGALAGHLAEPAVRRAALGAYAFLLDCLQLYKVAPEGCTYLRAKVGVAGCPDLASAVRVRLATVEQAHRTSASSVDMALRAALWVMREAQLAATWHAVLVAASSQLGPAYAMYQHMESLRRLRSPR